MRIAYFSPLPPVTSGIADYSAELLPYLGRHADITLFVDPGASLDDALTQSFPVCSMADVRGRCGEFDVPLYHMGNDVAHHEHIFRTMQETPGVVVLHETDFYHFFRTLTFARDDLETLRWSLKNAYGPAEGEYAMVQFHDWSRNRYALPPLSPILANAMGVIVHSQWACRQVRSCRPDLPVAVIPHHLSLPVPFDDAPSTGRGHPVDREAIRHDLSLAGYFVVGSFGFMTAAKRPKVLLRAFARFQRRHPDAICCMVGQEFPTVDLAGLIREAGLSPDTVRITGRMPLDGFLRYMIASDIAVNLRYPTSGETSGSVIRLLGLGVPTVVSDVGAFSELPDPVCAKVPVDAWEEDTLVAILEALAADDQQRQAMSANARRHIRTHHSLEGSAQAYAAFIEQVNAGDARPAGPLGASPAAEVISDIGTTLAGWGITEHHDSLLQPIAQPLAQLGIAPEPGHWEDTIESRDL